MPYTIGKTRPKSAFFYLLTLQPFHTINHYGEGDEWLDK